jgi:tetratricopeptide (TPR) repeat protein
MKIKDIFTDDKTLIYKITDNESENELEWKIKPTKLKLIPNEEDFFIVKALLVYGDKTIDCFINLTTCERISDFVFRQDENGQTVVESYNDYENIAIPCVASECFGVYDLYYSKENPEVGIDILKRGLEIAQNKEIIAEDLGYIYRDERRLEEAIEAFLISEQNQPSSEYTFSELAQLYGQLGQAEKQKEYEKKYKDNGGI